MEHLPTTEKVFKDIRRLSSSRESQQPQTIPEVALSSSPRPEFAKPTHHRFDRWFYSTHLEF